MRSSPRNKGTHAMLRHAGCLAAALMLLVPASLSAAELDSAMKERIERRFDASVLSVEEDTVDGQAVWLVKLMRGGNGGNAAFKVDVITLDPDTGKTLRNGVPALNPAHFLNATSIPMLDRRPDAFPRGRLEGR